MTLLSVIVPVYNVENYLDECIQSILSQSLTDFELILINDGSTDSSLDICTKYSQLDSRIRVIDKENGGQSSARNIGLDNAVGKYISFIDSDDYISNNVFEHSIDLLEQNNHLDFVVYPFKRIGTTRDFHYTLLTSCPETSMERLFTMWLNGKLLTNYLWDKIWRRKIFDGLRFREGMIYEDRHIFVDILNRTRSVIFSEKGIYYYRTHPNQTTAKHSRHSLEGMIEADSHIISCLPKNLKQEKIIVQKRLFSTLIEYYQNYGYSKYVFKTVTRSIGSLYEMCINQSIPIRMLLYKILGGKLYYQLLK